MTCFICVCSSSALVFDDADLEQAARAIRLGGYWNAGALPPSSKASRLSDGARLLLLLSPT